MTPHPRPRAVLACLMLALGPGAAQAAPDAELYARWPRIAGAVLSPSGQHLAMPVSLDNGQPALAVLDLPPTAPPRTVAGFRNADLDWARWVNDDRLVYGAAVRSVQIAGGQAGIFAVDLDGRQSCQLAASVDRVAGSGSRIATRLLPYDWTLLTTLDDGSDDVIMARQVLTGTGEPVDTPLARLDTRGGSRRSLGVGVPAGATQWVFDSKGVLRVLRTWRGGRERLYARDGEDWSLLDDRPTYDPEALSPVFLEGENNLVVGTHARHDTAGLYIYDLARRRLDPEPLAQAARYDIDEFVADRQQRRVVAVRLDADQPSSLWFSPRLAGIQRAVDAALPQGRFNHISCGRCETSAFFLLFSQSDRQPGKYCVYDAERQRLTADGATRPWIDEATQGSRTFHWIKARDGLPLPVVVTHPPGHAAREALPAVVVLHGGPWVRGGDRAWDAEARFLASRGYRVVQVEFRGGTGLGRRRFEAGLGQWGRAMQDDLADAAAWAVEQAMVDARRVCIYGASYGGDAALMGPARQPGPYRCAASFAGVTDILLMFSSSLRSDSTELNRRNSLPAPIGDPETDAARLREASPIERVAEIKVPVLLVQGTLDHRVPPENANRFEAAARRAGVALERVDYNDEAHGWTTPADQTDYLRQLEAFLARSLRD